MLIDMATNLRRWEPIGSASGRAFGCFRRYVPELMLNLAVVADGVGLTLVDTGSYELETDGFLDELAVEFPGTPVRDLVYTHGHFDHCYGGVAVVRRFPDVRVWGHEALPAYLAEWGDAGRVSGVDFGFPAAEMNSVRITPPTRLVAPGRPARVGRCVLHALGRGHTGADLAVHVPDAGLVVAGDVVEEGAEPSYGPDSFGREWPGALEELLELAPGVDLWLPGHGAVVDRGFVAAQLEFVRGVAGSGYGPGAGGPPRAEPHGA